MTGLRTPLPQGPSGKSFHLDVGDYYLRSLRKPDANADFVEWMSDADIITALNLPGQSASIEMVQSYIGKANNLDRYLIGIFAKPKMVLIGFYQMDVNIRHRKAVMTAAIGNKNWWGKNVLKETAGALIESFFEHRNIEKVSIRTLANNKRILFSLLGTKFKYEGCLRQEALSPNGERLDVHMFARLKDP